MLHTYPSSYKLSKYILTFYIHYIALYLYFYFYGVDKHMYIDMNISYMDIYGYRKKLRLASIFFFDLFLFLFGFLLFEMLILPNLSEISWLTILESIGVKESKWNLFQIE